MSVLRSGSGNTPPVAFTSGLTVPVGRPVLYKGSLWLARVAHTTTTTFEATKWRHAGRVKPDRLQAVWSRPPTVGGGASGWSNGTDLAHNSRFSLRIPKAAQQLVVQYGNWASVAGSYDTAGANPITVTSAVEIGSRSYPVTFGGQKSVTIASGGVVNSDPVGVFCPDATVGWVRSYVTVASAGNVWPTYDYPTVFAGWLESYDKGDATVTDKTTATGVLASNSASQPLFSPVAVLARAHGSNTPSVALLSDSIGCSPTRNSNLGAGGSYLARAFDAGNIPWVSLARIGDTAINWSATSSNPSLVRYRRAMLEYASHVVVCIGRNDITSFTYTQIRDTLAYIYDSCRAAGAQRVATCTITPKTTSTDGWATVANQTAEPTADSDRRQQLSDWMMTSAEVDWVIDAAALAHPPEGYGLWKAGYTSDGLHPNDTGAAALAAAVDTSLINFL